MWPVGLSYHCSSIRPGPRERIVPYDLTRVNDKRQTLTPAIPWTSSPRISLHLLRSTT